MRAAISAVLLAVTLGVAVLAGAQAPTREANELGRVMILEYHKIDTPEARWTRTPENFRRDLQRLWDRGYRLVALNDYIDGKIALPAGTSPVILTLDDSSPGQFRYIQRGSDWVIDPECGLGILEAFAREHPGFGRAATFYVLPGANPPNRLFNQPDLTTRKRSAQAAVQVRPWIQDFRDYAFDKRIFGPKEVRAQIRGADDGGGAGWMLWNPRNDYTADALKLQPALAGKSDR